MSPHDHTQLEGGAMASVVAPQEAMDPSSKLWQLETPVG